MSILIVEPSASDLTELEALLKSWGYSDIIPCRSLDDARVQLGLSSVSIHVLHDLELAIIDISETDSFPKFVDELRQKIYYQDIPILTLSEGSRSE
ncbi:MAG: hypothetical protein EOP07_14910, partial [Proteobacteria bacterium]